MKENKTYYMHLRHFGQDGLPCLKGGMTLAFELSHVEENDTFVFQVGKAICSEKDNFSRPIGRKVALERLIQGQKDMDVEPWNGHEMYAEVRTKYTLNEDIHRTLNNWAYGAV